MLNEYDLFRQAEALLVMKEQPRPVTNKLQGVEYLKLVQTGGLASVHHDYGRGFLVIKVFTASPAAMDGKFQTRLWFATVDDGDYGGWSQPMVNFDEALAHARKVADVFREMVELPTEDGLNKQLRPLRMWAGRE